MCPSAQTQFSGRIRSHSIGQHTNNTASSEGAIDQEFNYILNLDFTGGSRWGERKHKREKKERWFSVDFL